MINLESRKPILFSISLLLAILIVGSSTQSAQSVLPGVHFAATYELNYSTSDQSTDGEVWVSIHYTDGSIKHVQITNTTPDEEADPSIAIAPNGNIIVAWDHVEPLSVYFAVLDRSGAIVKGPTVLSSAPEDGDPCVAVTPNGVVFVVWEHSLDPDDVAYVTMNANGGGISPVKYISGVNGDIDDPTVAASTKNAEDNRVVIAWEDYDGTYDQVAFTILDSNGNTLVAKKTITAITETQEEINAAILPNGNTVIVWEGGPYDMEDDVGYAIIDKTGALVKPVAFIDRPLDIDSPGVAVAPGGNIVIVWDEATEEMGPDEVMYTVLSSSGDTIKPVTKLTSSDLDEDEPDVAVDNNGKVVVIYEQPFSPDERIDFAILDSNGNKQGTDQLTDGTHDVDLDADDGRRQVATEPNVPARPVAGVLVPVNKLEIVAPFAALAGLLVAVSAVVALKKRRD